MESSKYFQNISDLRAVFANGIFVEGKIPDRAGTCDSPFVVMVLRLVLKVDYRLKRVDIFGLAFKHVIF